MHPAKLLISCWPIALLAVATGMLACQSAGADAVTEWNVRDGEIVTAAGLNAPSANRAMAIAHTAAYEAANAITRRYPANGTRLTATPGASVDAAIAAAH